MKKLILVISLSFFMASSFGSSNQPSKELPSIQKPKSTAVFLSICLAISRIVYNETGDFASAKAAFAECYG